jgi:hypothetical protein
METSRDTTAETEKTTAIRLRYSRQFQSGGHAHTIDAEATLAVGANPERREQIIRELEADVEQLARQITQRGSRPASEARSQAPAHPGAAASKSTEPPAASPLPRPASQEAQPTAPVPVSGSMPAAPSASGGSTITLPQFLNTIRKRLDLSPEEAKELLGVNELTNLNYREAFSKLQALKEPHATTSSGPTPARARTTQQQPVVEAPRQANRATPGTSNPAPSASASAPTTAPITAAPKRETQPAPRATQAAPTTSPALTNQPEPKSTISERESLPDFAGSSRAPLPIQIATVRDIAPRYAFEEEDEEEYELPTDDGGDPHRQAAESKLAELKSKRGGNAPSPERLNVLNNIVVSQISEEQLEQLITRVWNITNKKRLKVSQVEALISWAKEDYFVDEFESLLQLVGEEEE